MKIGEIVHLLKASVLSSGDLDREIGGVVVGDLLSFIMAKGEEGWLWVTVQSHVNVAAVAVLKEMPVIVIASGRPIGDDMVEKCSSEGVTLLSSDLSSYEISGILYSKGIGADGSSI